MTIENPRTNMTPIGELARVLEKFEASAKISATITRSAGGAMHLLQSEQLDKIVLEHMPHGIPDWREIEKALRQVTHRAYAGKTFFIKPR